jgi:hypothetical protein
VAAPTACRAVAQHSAFLHFVIETQSAPASLVATLRDFAFYVAPPGRSIRNSSPSLALFQFPVPGFPFPVSAIRFSPIVACIRHSNFVILPLFHQTTCCFLAEPLSALQGMARHSPLGS